MARCRRTSVSAASTVRNCPHAATRGAVSDWALAAMNWAVSVGLIEGGDAGLAPQNGATRVELAAMFARFDAIKNA